MTASAGAIEPALTVEDASSARRADLPGARPPTPVLSVRNGVKHFPVHGGRFRTRYWKAHDVCVAEKRALVDRGRGHPVACRFAEAAEVV